MVLNTSSNLKKIFLHNLWSFAVMKSNLLVTPWADFPGACQAFWILARSAHLMLPRVTSGNWTALPLTFYFFRRLLRSTSKSLQIPKFARVVFIPELLCLQFKHRPWQAGSKADLLQHLLSEGQNALELPEVCLRWIGYVSFFIDLGGIDNLGSKNGLLLFS